MRWRASPFLAVSASLAFGLVGNVATNSLPIPSGQSKVVVWAVAAMLAGVSIFAEVGRARSEPVSLEVATGRLAAAVHLRLRRNEEAQQVADPVSLTVRWHLADDFLVDHWVNIHGVALGETAEPLDPSGEIVDVYRRIPSGRLVILGAAGSGKSVLAARLAMDLLNTRGPKEPVPYFVNIGSWNPAEPLREWLAGRLIRDDPALAAAYQGHRNLATALLDGERIWPILDGFDELGSGLHPAAFKRLNSVTRLRLVLTSRPEQYAEAVRRCDVLTGAAGITLDRLTPNDLAHYLPRTTRRAGWAEALGSSGLISEALSTPLMVYLARTTYSDRPGRDPAELAGFATVDGIEKHLLSAYLPAIYPSGKRSAERWLGYLAGHLTALDTPDLAWWRLRESVPRRARVFALGFSCFSATMLLTASPFFSQFILVPAAFVGAVFGTTVGSAEAGPGPVRAGFSLRRLRRPMTEGLATGIFGGSLAGVVIGVLSSYRVGVAAGTVIGMAVGLVGLLTDELEASADTTSNISVLDSLLRDRTNTLGQVLTVGFALAGVGGINAAILIGSSNSSDLVLPVAAGGFLIGVLFAIPAGLRTAWGQWLVLARVWLPLTGRLPWRLNTFLADAHRRGVLRQVGSVYQFRHDRLRDSLAHSSMLSRPDQCARRPLRTAATSSWAARRRRATERSTG